MLYTKKVAFVFYIISIYNIFTRLYMIIEQLR